jgi:hypothetical protein
LSAQDIAVVVSVAVFVGPPLPPTEESTNSDWLGEPALKPTPVILKSMVSVPAVVFLRAIVFVANVPLPEGPDTSTEVDDSVYVKFPRVTDPDEPPVPRLVFGVVAAVLTSVALNVIATAANADGVVRQRTARIASAGRPRLAPRRNREENAILIAGISCETRVS